MDISAVFELEREYGLFYKEWELDDDDVFDDECADEEENIALDAGLVGNGGTITLSPNEEIFPSLHGHPAHAPPRQSSHPPHRPLHERRRSFTGSQVSQSKVTAPLPRVRRNSGVMNGPSPLARIYTRDDPALGTSLGPMRRTALGVGSLPVTSHMASFSMSPRRTKAFTGAGQRDSTTSNTSAMSSSLSVSSITSEGRPWKSSSFQRPTVTPIQEVSTPVLTPKDSVSPEKSKAPRQGAVPFPRDDDGRSPHIKFGELPSATQLRRQSAPGTPEGSQSESTQTVPGAAPTPVSPQFKMPLLHEDEILSPRSTDVASKGETTPKSTPATKVSKTDTPTMSVTSAGSGTPTMGKAPSPTNSLALIPFAPTPFPKKPLRPPGPSPARGASQSQSSPTVPRASTTSGGNRPNANPSPHLKPTAPTKQAPKTASELLESMESHNTHSEHRVDVRTVEAQLAAVEARQERIEVLLERLLHCTESERGVNITPRRRGNEDHDTFDDDI